MSPRFGVVIFDNDGVLVDSEPLANRILSSLLSEYGLVMSAEQCMEEFLGSSLAQVRDRVSSRLATAMPADFEARYHAQLLAGFGADLRPVDGVADLLGALDAAGVTLCVASSGTRERIAVALASTGLAAWFDDRVVSVDDVARGKPCPDLFLEAARVANAKPESCAVVEDSAAGVEAALAAGMTPFGYAGLTPAERLAGARGGVVDSMAGLGVLLG
ncbi:MAG: HAD-IA family hydrolase, partial [Actinomycetota bacterium]|nr:HAD-IA family hydrolase [Actinomycetota bacterium]